jgi:hypothetical protein
MAVRFTSKNVGKATYNCNFFSNSTIFLESNIDIQASVGISNYRLIYSVIKELSYSKIEQLSGEMLLY